MKAGKVEKYINEKIQKEGGILLSLIDPDKTPFEKGARLAKAADAGGSDIILVGGSVGAHSIILDKTTKMIKENVDVPVVLFPGTPTAITPYADATYFMYVMNSRDVNWVTTAQIQGAPNVKRLGVEPIPTGYIIVEPGRAVGWISNANLIPRDKPELAAATALAAEYMGARLVITECGSGSKEPAPCPFIKVVKSAISIPYFYAGGCRTPQQAREIIKAGADGIQVGTAFEVNGYDKVQQKVSQMSKAIKQSGKEKLKHPYNGKSLFPSLRMPSIERLKRKWETRVEKLKQLKLNIGRKKEK
jgi:phosphoglycerol geranylgeranyltransferase